MTDTADRVAMRLAEALHGTSVGCNSSESGLAMLKKLQDDTRDTAAVLSSHGLREMVAACEILKVIEDLIETVENRCMAADGPVTPTEREIEPKEVRKLLVLALAAATEARNGLTALLGETASVPTSAGEALKEKEASDGR